jgi:hypothetical protein
MKGIHYPITPRTGFFGGGSSWPNGSDGDLNITTHVIVTTWSVKDYRNIYISPTGILEIQQNAFWTFIGCTGTFVIDGILRVVNTGAAGTILSNTPGLSGALTGPPISHNIVQKNGGNGGFGNKTRNTLFGCSESNSSGGAQNAGGGGGGGGGNTWHGSSCSNYVVGNNGAPGGPNGEGGSGGSGGNWASVVGGSGGSGGALSGGNGGGGGVGNVSGASGPGGGGGGARGFHGGCLMIRMRSSNLVINGSIQAKGYPGGNGGAGASTGGNAGGAGGGGGGAGGSGGKVSILTPFSVINFGNIDISGGPGGTGGTQGGAAIIGSAGDNGQNGNPGVKEVIVG